MSTSTSGNESEFEVEVEAELSLAESSDPERAAELPASEWLFDPADVEREEVGLRNLLGAAEGLEAHSRSRRDRTGEGA
ncbi:MULTISPECIES: hypothetical protein [Actinomadura]|uniref:Uncharacterized protein n=1 Tax=Actinomadura yumaensis TaxID=111807 RepID=A0ABW2CEP1_9ACTN|nr:hypothetical protein [Actinomadura sp. J1-007]MWK38439.1 hypothetical protein [Actinomadura sp. J1-007]